MKSLASCLLVACIAAVSLISPSPLSAQQSASDPLRSRQITRPIPSVAAVGVFDQNGLFGIEAAVQARITAHSSTGNAITAAPPQPGTPSIPPFEAQVSISVGTGGTTWPCGRIGGHCPVLRGDQVGFTLQGSPLGGGGVVIVFNLPPAPGVPPRPGRLNVHSTRVDRVEVAHRAVDNLWRDAPLPNIKLGINPDPGITGMSHWFWVNNYQGQPLVFPLHLDLPWTLYWQEQVWETTMECVDSGCLTRHAVTTSHLEDHSANYVDTVDLGVTLTSSEWEWDFGDGIAGSKPPPFEPTTGIGRAYTDPYTPSPVKWFYNFDSRDFVGGFPVTLQGKWTGTYRIASASTFDGPYSESGTLGGNRAGIWTARHVVCQVQALNIMPGYKPPEVGCRDPRV